MKPNEQTRAKLRYFQAKFSEQLPEKMSQIEQAWNLAKQQGSISTITKTSELYRHIHSLAGSAGTFGHRNLGSAARLLEVCLIESSENSVINSDIIETIEQHLEKIRSLALEKPDTPFSALNTLTSHSRPTDSSDTVLVYILEDEEVLANEVSHHLQYFGYETEVFSCGTLLVQALKERQPNALIVDIHLPEGSMYGAKIITESIAPSLDIPMIFMSASDGWEERIAAVRAGGNAFLSKPFDFNDLVEQLDHLCSTKIEEPYRVMIVDDSELLSSHYALILEQAGIMTEVINNPEQILSLLPAFRPELILMDIYMPVFTGTEIAQMLRQHPAYLNIPIVFLSTESTLQKQLQALRIGGDDFLQKPIDDTHLISAVEIRCRRFRQIHSFINRDSLTGLLNHSNLKLELEREIALTKRRGTPLAFAMIDIDHFKSVNDQYGHCIGDRVIKSLSRLLKRGVRKSDIVARYGGEEFAVILPDTNLQDAALLLDKLRSRFADLTQLYNEGDFQATFSAGIAVLENKRDAHHMIEAADQALYDAKHQGRNRVCIDESTKKSA